MREVPIKYVLKGDREAGKLFMRRGAVLMGMLEHGMSYRGLKQGVMRRWLTPDVLIECDCRFGLRTVTITVAPHVVVTPKGGEEKIVIRMIVSVSDADGMRLHTAPCWEKNFTPATPLNGYYEPIPDGYWGNTSYQGLFVFRRYWKTGTVFRGEGAARPVDTRQKIEEFHDDILYYPHYDASFLKTGSLVYNNNHYEYVHEGGCKWATPALLPWSKDCFVSSFHALRGCWDETAPDPYEYADADTLYMNEISLSCFNKGKHDYWYKFIALKRGSYLYGFGDVGNISLQPERNGAQRHVVMTECGHLFRQAPRDPALFQVVTIRGEYDVRRVPFLAKYMSALFPEFLREALLAGADPNNIYFYVWGNAAFTDEETGELIVWMLLNFHCEKTYNNFLKFEEQREWCLALCRFIVPAVVPNMAWDAEEEKIINETRMDVIATGRQMLPFMDVLGRYPPGMADGPVYYEQGRIQINDVYSDELYTVVHPVLLYKGTGQDSLPYSTIKYTVGGRMYHENSFPYDIEDVNRVHVYFNRVWQLCLFLFTWGRLSDQKTQFHYKGSAYVWSRHFGGVALTPEGMSPQEMLWPPEVATDVRARPNTTYAGRGMFCCVCERAGEQVTAVYVGAPFATDEREAGWRKIELVTEEWAAVPGNRIEYVRPMLATEERVALLAIVRDGTAGGGTRYRAALCDGSPEEPGATLLRFYGVIPTAPLEDGVSWDFCVLNGDEGYDEYAEMLKRYPGPVNVLHNALYNPRAGLLRIHVDSTTYVGDPSRP